MSKPSNSVKTKHITLRL